MNNGSKTGKIIILAGRKLWPHELRVAEILADTGYCVEFLPESNLHTPDISKLRKCSLLRNGVRSLTFLT